MSLEHSISNQISDHHHFDSNVRVMDESLKDYILLIEGFVTKRKEYESCFSSIFAIGSIDSESDIRADMLRSIDSQIKSWIYQMECVLCDDAEFLGIKASIPFESVYLRFPILKKLGERYSVRYENKDIDPRHIHMTAIWSEMKRLTNQLTSTGSVRQSILKQSAKGLCNFLNLSGRDPIVIQRKGSTIFRKSWHTSEKRSGVYQISVIESIKCALQHYGAFLGQLTKSELVPLSYSAESLEFIGRMDRSQWQFNLHDSHCIGNITIRFMRNFYEVIVPNDVSEKLNTFVSTYSPGSISSVVVRSKDH